ncbi:centromere protein k [Malassezia pachydermatis]|uniref:Centromere protein k n=1 Tax=Malassezia pachydermatis TaxID=77020 RepID=A0A0M8MWY5_9BASI|nr:centromere protein k [Malassezia pachydermatis]KOS15460.1 centromere protein k [Malassezia pachydermatis]
MEEAQEECRRLDRAILEAQKNLAAPPTSLQATQDVNVLRQQLTQCVEQHRILLQELEQELRVAKSTAEDQQTLCQELHEIEQAWQAQPEIPTSSHSEKALLKVLVSLTEHAFADPELCVQLRLLLEWLLNALWEQPDDPYVRTKGLDPSVLAFVQQAQLIEHHPSQAGLVRLVAFHEPMPDPQTLRPTLYK